MTALVPSAMSADDLGLRVAPGFRVSLYAGHELANDIFAMTLDSQGRVVVSGSGYVKMLHDTNGDGRADQATVFASPPRGAMGLCFDGNDLYFCGNGWFSRYRDRDGDGKADGEPELLLPMAHGEHGGHAMRKGPDGWWYLVGGNDTGFGPRHASLPASPVRKPEGGALLRLTPDCRKCEVIAQGFRNPYDFDFNEHGELFTYDSDCEREFFLPWYTPTRVYHIAYAGHHGWRLPGYLRSWCRKPYYPDTVDILWPIGRGSPTGVACYRHWRFPKRYRGGLFVLDWTFGKVYFLPLAQDGSSYHTKAEVFLESTGSNGFDPTDIAVAPDGSLFISMGGRGTRGAVYRVEHVGSSEKREEPSARATDLQAVLQAAQPLDAWSRARWMPLASRLGREAFTRAIVDEGLATSSRLRALEIHTEMFGALTRETALAASRSLVPLVRARTAWAIGRVPCPEYASILRNLVGDAHPVVARSALDAMFEQRLGLSTDPTLAEIIEPVMGSSDKRVRQAAARVLSRLDGNQIGSVVDRNVHRSRITGRQSAQNVLTACLAALEKSQDWNELVFANAAGVLGNCESTELWLQAVRLMIRALGDYCLDRPAIESHTGYSLQIPLTNRSLVEKHLPAVRKRLPSGNADLDLELSRLLAMVEDDDGNLPSRISAFWTKASSPTADLHYLIVLSRLRGPRTTEVTTQTAATLLSLHTKLEGQQLRIKQTWDDRLAEIVGELIRKDPLLADELLKHPKLVDAGHIPLAAGMPSKFKVQAAQKFLDRVKKDPEIDWSMQLIELLAALPPERTHPDFRRQWHNHGLRQAILLQLARKPEALDRDKFLFGLEAGQPEIMAASLAALERLPPDPSPANLVPLLRTIGQLAHESKAAAMRRQLLGLVNRQTGQHFTAVEVSTDPLALKRAYRGAFAWFEREYPALADKLQPAGEDDPAAFLKLIRSVDWEKGDARRGEILFESRTCHTCHTGTRALGPDLTGVANRFSREDLFAAIVFPSRDVAPLYRMSTVEMRNGQVHNGIVAFESADGLILQTGAATTLRLATADIAGRFPNSRSLMPAGLLKDLKPTDLADLYRYLQTLKVAHRP